MNTFRLTLAACFLFAATLASAANLTSSVDRTTLRANETLELTVTYEGDALFADVDFSVLDNQFERVSAPSRQQSYSLINGRSESSLSWSIALHPKNTGTLTIPEFEIDGVRSAPLTITVKPAASGPGQDSPVFLDVEADKQSLYVQEQLLLTYRLYHQVSLANINPGWGNIDNAEVLQLGENQYQTTLNGRSYEVREWKFALFPTASGTLNIPAFRINAYSPSGIRFRSGRRFNQFSDTLSLTVKPKPANGGSHWLPARNIELQEQAIDPNKEWRVGEPLTRRITLTGVGTTSTLLPEINLPLGSGLRSYPDQPQLDQTAAGNGVVASRTESIALVPGEAGIVTLPPVEVQWWDTSENTLKTARLPERTLQVLPAETTAYTPPPTQSETTPAELPPQQPDWWLRLSVALNIALLILLVVLLLQRRKQPQADIEQKFQESAYSNEKELFTVLRRHAKAGEIQQTRKAVLQWAQCYWPKQSAITLDKLGRLVGDPELTQQFDALDQVLYGATTPQLDLQWIATQLKRFRAHGGNASKSKNKRELQPLYPQ
ncbi:MAG: BatD family protein [Porticoccaceae bacterium]|nr:BatD family protein [Porticoccaceae bacterium]